MNWQELKTETELEDIKTLSKTHPVMIFKHSTRCSISAAALDRLERNWKEAEMKNVQPYYLDLISHRPISNKIQNDFHVQHESPQVLIIRDGKCIYSASHIDINYKEIKEWV
ncbi:MAG TPA: bacillithiol system redox-active protein YtxJ [Cytophagaceae bacterium]|jgi:bacillithiol system protein YtxJ|nr:bacillithiol system redox-active protein YtxJ [Cytophagaceae bacterium]